MSTTTIQIRVDEETKDKANIVFNDLGIDMSTAVRMFLNRVVKDWSIDCVANPGKTTKYVNFDAASLGMWLDGRDGKTHPEATVRGYFLHDGSLDDAVQCQNFSVPAFLGIYNGLPVVTFELTFDLLYNACYTAEGDAEGQVSEYHDWFGHTTCYDLAKFDITDKPRYTVVRSSKEV